MSRKLWAAASILAFVATGAAFTATPAHADPAPVVHPVASPAEDQAAMAAFTTQLGLATAVGGLGGTAAGAVVGCLVGAGIVAIPTALIATPVGCIAGAVAIAPAGAVIGTLLAGGPTLALAGGELVGTLTAAPETTKWATR